MAGTDVSSMTSSTSTGGGTTSSATSSTSTGNTQASGGGHASGDAEYIGELAAEMASMKAFTLQLTKIEMDAKKFMNSHRAIQGTIRDMPA